MDGIDNLLIDLEQTTEIAASRSASFEALLIELTDGLRGQDDTPMQLELERRPGGRWVRNLGDDNGHLWGHVQSIREPDLLEIIGPLFMSYPVSNHLIFRLEEAGEGTIIGFRHRAFGLIEEGHREGVKDGWSRMLENVKARATA